MMKFKTINVGVNAEAMRELCEFSRDVDDVVIDLAGLLLRHISGDWGDVDREDWATNNRALKTGARLLSAYELHGVKLWIISDAAWPNDPIDVRRVTTILRPCDY